jgi:hypothetical protein
MSNEIRQTVLREKSEQLLRGSLKHVRVAALAAALVPLASVAISRAVVHGQCVTSCGVPAPAVPSPCDFITSGGFILTDAGKMANFGAHGGCKLDGFWGHVNYVDHTNEYHLNSIQITGYLTVPSVGPNARDICGWATTNNPSDPQPVMFRVRLVDNGEPGVASQFGIIVANGAVPYHVITRLLNSGMGGGGDVQLHKDNPSTTPPNPLPDETGMCGILAGVQP